MENTISSTFIAEVTDRPYNYVMTMIKRKNKNGAVKVQSAENVNTNGGRGRPRTVVYLGREDALKIILFLSGREKSEGIRRLLETADQVDADETQYLTREPANEARLRESISQMDGVGTQGDLCSEIDVEGEQEMTSNQVAVRQDDGEMKMSSREIADLTGKTHKNIIRDIRDLMSNLYEDGSKMIHEQNQGVTEQKDPRGYTSEFWLDRYHTEILITGYDVKRRAAVIKRWFDLESGAATPHHQQVQQPALPDFTNPVEAARAWADQLEGRQNAEAQALEYKGQSEQYQQEITKNAPKVEFAEQVGSMKGSMKVREAAKFVDLSQQRLFAKLREWGWVMEGYNNKNRTHRNEPFQSFINSGHLRSKITSEYRDPETGKLHIKKTTLVTGKGLALIQKKLAKGE